MQALRHSKFCGFPTGCGYRANRLTFDAFISRSHAQRGSAAPFRKPELAKVPTRSMGTRKKLSTIPGALNQTPNTIDLFRVFVMKSFF